MCVTSLIANTKPSNKTFSSSLLPLYTTLNTSETSYQLAHLTVGLSVNKYVFRNGVHRAHLHPAPLYPAGCFVSIGIVGAFKCFLFLSLKNVCFLQ